MGEKLCVLVLATHPLPRTLLLLSFFHPLLVGNPTVSPNCPSLAQGSEVLTNAVLVVLAALRLGQLVTA